MDAIKIMLWVVWWKSVLIGSDFSFYHWWKYGKIYLNWYNNRPTFKQYLSEFYISAVD